MLLHHVAASPPLSIDTRVVGYSAQSNTSATQPESGPTTAETAVPTTATTARSLDVPALAGLALFTFAVWCLVGRSRMSGWRYFQRPCSQPANALDSVTCEYVVWLSGTRKTRERDTLTGFPLGGSSGNILRNWHLPAGSGTVWYGTWVGLLGIKCMSCALCCSIYADIRVETDFKTNSAYKLRSCWVSARKTRAIRRRDATTQQRGVRKHMQFVQGHPRSLILVRIESAYATSY